MTASMRGASVDTRASANLSRYLQPCSRKRSRKTLSAQKGSTCTHRPQKYFCAYASGTTPAARRAAAILGSRSASSRSKSMASRAKASGLPCCPPARHTHTHTQTQTHRHRHRHRHTQTRTRARAHTHTHTHTHSRSSFVSGVLPAHIYIYIYTYIYIQKTLQTQR